MKNTNLILGKISSGKTKDIMFKEVNKLIQNNENLLIVDNKEEYYNNYMQELIDNGYKTYVINFKDSTLSNGFNPLLLPYKYYKNGKKDIAIKLIKDFSCNIMSIQNVIDPFWQDSAADYLSGLILILFNECNDESKINLGSVQLMVSSLNEGNYDKFQKYVSNLDIMSPEYMLISGTALSPRETRGGIISILKQELNKYVITENLLNLLCSNELDLSKINSKTAIFILGNNEYAKLTNSIISEVFKLTELNKISFNFILDNFDSLTKITNFEDLLETSIELKNKVYIVSRNIDDINSKYGKFIIDRIEEIINVNYEGDKEEVKLNNYSKYPKQDSTKNSYFDFTSLLK